MLRAIILLAATGLLGCEAPPPAHHAILGKWKSNEKLTLMSVNRVEGISPQTRAFLANDFFGHLTIHIRENESRTTHAKDSYDSGFEPYEVLEVTDEFVRVKAWSNFFQDYDERTLYLKGECYYLIFNGFQFREYFCRYS